jgi:RNA polymerase sigma factor (sigma-70 family)
MDNEKKWIRRIKAKSDKLSANELVTKYYKQIYAFVYKQTLNKELAMDLTQEIFTSMLQTIASYNERKASFRTWLYQVSTYRIVDYYRSKYYQSNRLDDPIEDHDFPEDHDFTVALEYKQEVEQVMDIVNTLDARSQQIFRLKLYADHTFVEIAALLQLTESTVKTSYYTMIRKIKQRMVEDNNG